MPTLSDPVLPLLDLDVGSNECIILEPPIRVMALHAMMCCERLFYLEEAEAYRIADSNVYAGRWLHDACCVRGRRLAGERR